MRSSSESMSLSMSLSRTVSSDRSMSIEDDGGKGRDRRSPAKSKFDSLSRDNHRTNHRDKDSSRGRRRSSSRSSSVSRSTSSSSVSYDKYKNYKNFKRNKYSTSTSRSRSYSKGRKHKKSYSYSSSYRSRSSSTSRESVSSSSSRSRRPRPARRREEVRRVPDRRGVRDYHNARDRPRIRMTNRRDLRMKSLRDIPRQDDKHKLEGPRLNGRSRVTEKINGKLKSLNEQIKGLGQSRGAKRESKREHKVDRRHNTPFLLKVMAPPTDSADEGITSEELHVYVWLDSTLRDLVNLIKDISPPTRKHTSTWRFTTNKGEDSTQLGVVHSFKINPREDNRTLESLRFEIGSTINLTFKD